MLQNIDGISISVSQIQTRMKENTNDNRTIVFLFTITFFFVLKTLREARGVGLNRKIDETVDILSA